MSKKNGGLKTQENVTPGGANQITEFVRRRGHEEIVPGALKLKPAARYLGGLSVPTMHRLVRRGLLRPNRATRHYLFSRTELDRFLADGMTTNGNNIREV